MINASIANFNIKYIPIKKPDIETFEPIDEKEPAEEPQTDIPVAEPVIIWEDIKKIVH